RSSQVFIAYRASVEPVIGENVDLRARTKMRMPIDNAPCKLLRAQALGQIRKRIGRLAASGEICRWRENAPADDAPWQNQKTDSDDRAWMKRSLVHESGGC